MAAKMPSKIVTTPIGRAAYVYLDEPDTGREFSDGKYKVDLILEPEKAKPLIDACKEVALKAFNTEDLTTIKVTAVKDGDDRPQPEPGENDRYKIFRGKAYVTAKTINSIVVRDAKGDKMEAKDFYAGCYARLKVKVAAYQKGANKGITAYLIAAQFVADGEELGVSTDSFKAVTEDDMQEVLNLKDTIPF